MLGRLEEAVMLYYNIQFRYSSLEAGKEDEDGPDVLPCI